MSDQWTERHVVQGELVADPVVDPIAEPVVDPVAGGWGAPGRCRWPADAAQLSAIRIEVHRRLAVLALSDDTRDDLVLAVNEAASNAVEHAYGRDRAGDVELAFWLDDRHLHIAVVDRGTWREPAPDPRGRGLGIGMMRRLVAGVSVDHDDRGTRVVLRHPLAGRVEQPDPPHAVTDGAGRR